MRMKEIMLLRSIRDMILFKDIPIPQIIENFSYDIIDCDVFVEKVDDAIRIFIDKYNSTQEILYIKFLNHVLSKCTEINIEKSTESYAKSWVKQELNLKMRFLMQ